MGAEEQRQQKFDRMTKTPIPRLIGELAIPTIISMLVTSFYNMADTFFVGKINTSATAAVGIVFPLMAMIQAFGFFCGHGSGNYISRQLGAHNFEDASKMSATGFVSAFVLGLGILVVGFLFTDPLLRIMGSTETILPYARSYMRIILIGAPYMTASLVLNNQLRFQGSAFYSMIGITTGAVLNIVLDPLFIFVLDMGVAGAALATIISQFVSFCLLIAGTFRGGNLRLNLRDFSPSLKYYQNIVKGGAPSLFRQGLGSFAIVCLNLMAGPYGDAAIAAMSIVTRISQFAASVVIGFGQGFQPVCGFNYGAKLFKRTGGLLVLRQILHLGPAGGGSVRLDFLAQPHRHLPQNRPAGHRIRLTGAAPASTDLPAGRVDHHFQHDAANHRQNDEGFSAGDVPTVSLLCSCHPDPARIFRDFGRSAQPADCRLLQLPAGSSAVHQRPAGDVPRAGTARAAENHPRKLTSILKNTKRASLYNKGCSFLSYSP